MLTDQEKQAMLEQRVKFYEAKIFELEMDKAACSANGEPVEDFEKNIEGLRKAIEAVKTLSA